MNCVPPDDKRTRLIKAKFTGLRKITKVVKNYVWHFHEAKIDEGNIRIMKFEFVACILKNYKVTVNRTWLLWSLTCCGSDSLMFKFALEGGRAWPKSISSV